MQPRLEFYGPGWGGYSSRLEFVQPRFEFYGPGWGGYSSGWSLCRRGSSFTAAAGVGTAPGGVCAALARVLRRRLDFYGPGWGGYSSRLEFVHTRLDFYEPSWSLCSG